MALGGTAYIAAFTSDTRDRDSPSSIARAKITRGMASPQNISEGSLLGE